MRMTIQLCSLSSGSAGNAVFLDSGRRRFLVDVGFSGKQTEYLLSRIGQRARDIDYILVTHEHGDHTKGVGILSRKYDLPILANAKTWLAMKNRIGKIKPKNMIVFETDKAFQIEDTVILPLHTHHDAADSVAFVFETGGRKISVMTDTGRVDRTMQEAIKGSDAYYLESNHDVPMLLNGPYPEDLKQRILSNYGHLSNVDAGRLLGDVLEARGEHVILAHLSEENNTPEIAYQTAFSSLYELGMDVEKDIHLEVAPRFACSGMVSFESKERSIWSMG